MSTVSSQTCCDVCGSSRRKTFFEVKDVPVHVCTLWETREKAAACPKGSIRLVFCEECGLIHNDVFDPALAEYTEAYENSLGFSAIFQEYAEEQALGIIERFNLRDKDIVEIGCGDGAFLQRLCRDGANRGFGYDPSFSGTIDDPSVSIVRDYYSEKYADQAADLIMARQVLEHIPGPLAFLKGLHRVIGDRDCGLFFEVPSVLHTLENLALWEIIYEHCTYFSPGSMSQVFTRAGFEVTDVRETYERQFLTLDARKAKGTSEAQNLDEDLPRLVSEFEAAYKEKVASCARALDEVQAKGQKAVAWGGGARGVNFMNFVGVEDAISHMVDINPRKHGKFVPGTGQEVVAPEKLPAIQPDVVFIFNEIYRDEIQASLQGMGLESRVVPV